MLTYVIALVLPTLTLTQSVSLKPYNQTATSMFLKADQDMNGYVDRNEVDLHFKQYDTDHNGRVTRLEYTNYMIIHDPFLEDFHDALYDIYDVDNDHVLEHHDFDNFFALMDGDGNGQVSHYEFVRYVQWSS